MSDILEKTWKYEEKHVKEIPEESRPAFHLTPAVGWMNDPNGFSVYKGEYHLFYQYHPYSCQWGPMHWGHVKSKDLLHWERLPAAMAPDQEYDKDGCFSGSALELPDGRHLLVYTGVWQGEDAEGVMQQRQTQCLAIGDGIHYEKWAANPVLVGKDLPQGGNPADFRDPKVWQEPDGTYYMVVGNRDMNNSGVVLLYRSENAMEWTLVGPVDESRGEYGTMWECPDFFCLDGRQVLLTSPTEMKSVDLEFHPGHGTVCIIGSYNAETNQFCREQIQAIDYGIDFYAPQTIAAPDGRRVMIGWMQNWNTLAERTLNCKWFGQMSIPRELSVREGRLYQYPLRELEQYRTNPAIHRNVTICCKQSLPGVSGRKVDLQMKVRPVEHGSYNRFRITLAENETYSTLISYNPFTGMVKLDRSMSGTFADVVHSRKFQIKPGQEEIDLRILVDQFSVELFINGGEQAATVAIFTPLEAQGISFEASGSAILDIEKYDIVL